MCCRPILLKTIATISNHLCRIGHVQYPRIGLLLFFVSELRVGSIIIHPIRMCTINIKTITLISIDKPLPYLNWKHLLSTAQFFSIWLVPIFHQYKNKNTSIWRQPPCAQTFRREPSCCRRNKKVRSWSIFKCNIGLYLINSWRLLLSQTFRSAPISGCPFFRLAFIQIAIKTNNTTVNAFTFNKIQHDR